LLAMNAICHCQAGQKSDHGLKTAGNLANVGLQRLALRRRLARPIAAIIPKPGK
jgi:hypothetical protein